MAVTMKQVAEQAGVSVPVVSMVLNGSASTAGVSASRAARVRKVADELGYRTSWKAAALRKGRTRLIGMLSARHAVTKIHDSRLLVGLEETFAEAGYHLSFASALPGNDDMIRDGRFDGCLIDYVVEPEQISAVTAVKLPCVIINAPGREGLQGVRLDQQRAAHTAVDQLVARGHRRICFIGLHQDEPDAALWDQECHDARLQGYRDAMKDAGLDANICIERVDLGDPPGAAISRIRHLPAVAALRHGSATAPTAFVGYDHRLTLHVREALLLDNLHCPVDYSLVALHDDIMLEALASPIAAMHADYAALGRLAASRLLDKVLPKRARRVRPQANTTADQVIDFQWRERSSVGPPASGS